MSPAARRIAGWSNPGSATGSIPAIFRPGPRTRSTCRTPKRCSSRNFRQGLRRPKRVVRRGGADRPRATWGNGFIANYGFGRDREWQASSADVPGWHVDGDSFLHFLDSPEQGLLIVAIFSDIHPKGGGTYIACDSVPLVARYLAEHPEGVEPNGFPCKDIIRRCRDFREATGKAGDVFLLHPFMLHTSSYNHRPEARLMINPSACCFSRCVTIAAATARPCADGAGRAARVGR